MIPKVLALLLALTMATTLLSTASDDMQTYIVYMDPLKIKEISNPHQWYLSLLNSITEKVNQEEVDEGGLKQSIPQLLYAYQNVFSGFSAKLSAKQLQYLREVDGFVYATRDEEFQPETTHSYGFLGLREGQGLWSPSNLNEVRDVIIGVLDTGIWPEHDSFQDPRMPQIPARWRGICQVGPSFTQQNCNAKLIGARIFLNGFEAEHGALDTTINVRSPRDTSGHGTHTASTAAGNLVPNANLFRYASGTASGMANTARIAVYKVCWYYRQRASVERRSGCSAADIAAAIDQAVADGVDVISQSLGSRRSPVPFYESVVDIAAFGATRNGIPFVVSAGNEGPNGKTVKNPAPWMMTVAASSIDRSFPNTLRLGNGLTFQGSSVFDGAAVTNLLLFKPTGDFRYCNRSLDVSQVQGKIVICKQGGNVNALQKGEIVKSAGGAGIILETTTAGEAQVRAHVLPAFVVGNPATFTAIESYASSSTSRASISFSQTRYGDRAPVVAGFSSRGPNPVEPHILKPDIIAPGLNVLAAWPSDLAPSRLDSDGRRVQFNIMSGTSMACPHIGGIAALLKARDKNWSPAMIKSAMMTTAYTMDNKKGPIRDFNTQSANPFMFGSGHVDPEKAANPGLVYDISTDDYLTYLCKLGYTPQQIQLFNGGRPFTCPTGKGVPDLNYPSFAVRLKRTASSRVTYTREVTNVGTPRSTYTAKVKAPSGVLVEVNPKKLVFRNLDQKLSFSVAFSYKGATSEPASFGSLTWESSSGYAVGSPIAVTWVKSEGKFQDLLETVTGEEDEFFNQL